MARLREILRWRSAPAPTLARESLDILNAIIAHIVVPMFVLDREGKVTIWN